jgi:solute carrier family 39 (zinc transporter), member 9
MVIFFAILMHKIPAAIGLGTFLQRCDLTTLWFNIYLCAFTLTSPIAALMSYGILSGTVDDKGDFKRTIGVLLLISAGTFLYVATMHILPSKGGHDHSNNGEKVDKNKQLRDSYKRLSSSGDDQEK